MKIQKFISLLLSVLMFLSLFSLTACSKSETYMTVGNQEVSYDFVKRYVKLYTEGIKPEELQDETRRQEIRDAVLRDIKMVYVILHVAEELSLVLPSDTEDGIEEILDMMNEDKDNFKKMLEQQYATEEVFETLLYVDAYDDIVFDALTEGGMGGDRFSATNDIIDADLKKGDWYAADFVTLYIDGANTEARKKDLEKAKEALASGKTLKEATADLKKLYGSECLLTQDGCFTSTIYNEDVDKAVKSLKVGEVSEIIETYSTSDGSDCLMILRRNAISDSYVDEKYNTIISQYLTREYAAYMKERAEDLTVTVLDKFKDQDILDIE